MYQLLSFFFCNYCLIHILWSGQKTSVDQELQNTHFLHLYIHLALACTRVYIYLYTILQSDCSIAGGAPPTFLLIHLWFLWHHQNGIDHSMQNSQRTITQVESQHACLNFSISIMQLVRFYPYKINARLRQESSKAMEWSRTLLFKRHAVPRYSQDASICNLACFCTLLGLCYSTLQSLKGTQKEKYSINTLYDETVVVYEI